MAHTVPVVLCFITIANIRKPSMQHTLTENENDALNEPRHGPQIDLALEALGPVGLWLWAVRFLCVIPVGLHAATGTGTLAASLAGAGLPSAGLGLGLGPRVQGVLGVIRDVAALSSFRLLKSAGNYTRSSPS